jgi:hypothetical protein
VQLLEWLYGMKTNMAPFNAFAIKEIVSHGCTEGMTEYAVKISESF